MMNTHTFFLAIMVQDKNGYSGPCAVVHTIITSIQLHSQSDYTIPGFRFDFDKTSDYWRIKCVDNGTFAFKVSFEFLRIEKRTEETCLKKII